MLFHLIYDISIMINKKLLLSFVVLFMLGCETEQVDKPAFIPKVKTFTLVQQNLSTRVLSGTVRSRHEIPLAFRINGRIQQRLVDAGQHVKKGDLLFSLDPSDLQKELDARNAESSAAKSALAVAKADVKRSIGLLKKKFISQQAIDRFKLVERETRERLNAAYARAKQAKNALSYTRLVADFDGLLMSVSGESGQVIVAGQTVAIQAKSDELEVEVFFPEEMNAPAKAWLISRGIKKYSISLREIAGAADPVSRTWRARYSIEQKPVGLALGKIVRASFSYTDINESTLEIPLAALDERGTTPQVWQVVKGVATAYPVQLISIRSETALINTELPVGTRIISLGTHLLQSGMAVEELGL